MLYLYGEKDAWYLPSLEVMGIITSFMLKRVHHAVINFVTEVKAGVGLHFVGEEWKINIIDNIPPLRSLLGLSPSGGTDYTPFYTYIKIKIKKHSNIR